MHLLFADGGPRNNFVEALDPVQPYATFLKCFTIQAAFPAKKKYIFSSSCEFFSALPHNTVLPGTMRVAVVGSPVSLLWFHSESLCRGLLTGSQEVICHHLNLTLKRLHCMCITRSCRTVALGSPLIWMYHSLQWYCPLHATGGNLFASATACTALISYISLVR